MSYLSNLSIYHSNLSLTHTHTHTPSLSLTPSLSHTPYRSLHDALCVIKRMLESNSLVAGGGAVEAALSIYLDGVATSMGSREQLAVAQFAEALLVIPRTLSG